MTRRLAEPSIFYSQGEVERGPGRAASGLLHLVGRVNAAATVAIFRAGLGCDLVRGTQGEQGCRSGRKKATVPGKRPLGKDTHVSNPLPEALGCQGRNILAWGSLMPSVCSMARMGLHAWDP